MVLLVLQGSTHIGGDIFVATCFKDASRDLYASLASVARRICSSYVSPTLIAPMLACRLIALDKNPGVHPIGIGDTAQRIIAKALLSIAGPNIQDASSCQHLCGGQIAGIEAAVYATRSAFESDDCKAVLLVDATNAFNALNRMVALHNIRRICPPIATILINSYRSPIELFVDMSSYCRKVQPRVTLWPWPCMGWQQPLS